MYYYLNHQLGVPRQAKALPRSQIFYLFINKYPILVVDN